MMHPDTLEKLLDSERSALLDMDGAALKKALKEKENFTAQDWPQGLKSNDLGALKEKAQRNQKLMDAALAGLRQAAEVLARHRTNKREISVYNHVGERSTISAVRRSALERKA